VPEPVAEFFERAVVKPIPTTRGQSVELSIDLFNILNLLNSRWGRITQTAQFEEQPMLTQTGYDAVHQRGIYRLLLPTRPAVLSKFAASTRWPKWMCGSRPFSRTVSCR